MKYFYHLTTPEGVAAIMKEGLKPMLGERSLSIGDTGKKICLCTKESVDAWAILLGLDTVLKLTVPSEEDLIDVSCGETTDEYHYKYPIPADYIISVSKINPSGEALDELRCDYIVSLSRFCELCARYYTEGTGWRDGGVIQQSIEEEIEAYGEAMIPVVPRLKYQEMDRKEIRTFLKDCGENGMFTFCDEYAVGVSKEPAKRLYQMLVEYPDDQFTMLRKAVNGLIRQNFKNCLRVNTGGWTG